MPWLFRQRRRRRRASGDIVERHVPVESSWSSATSAVAVIRASSRCQKSAKRRSSRRVPPLRLTLAALCGRSSPASALPLARRSRSRAPVCSLALPQQFNHILR